MRGYIRRVVSFVVVLLAAILGAAAPSHAFTPRDLPIVSQVYNDDHVAPLVSSATSERGPPAKHDHHTAYDAVDHRSHGASARLDGTTPAVAFTYDHHAPLAHAASVTSAAHMGAGVVSGDPRASTGASVAANGVSKFRSLSHSSAGIAPFRTQRALTAGQGGTIQPRQLQRFRLANSTRMATPRLSTSNRRRLPRPSERRPHRRTTTPLSHRSTVSSGALARRDDAAEIYAYPMKQWWDDIHSAYMEILTS